MSLFLCLWDSARSALEKVWFDQVTSSLIWTPSGPPTLSLHSQSHLFKVGTDHTVPLLKHYDGSSHGPQSLRAALPASPTPSPNFSLWDTYNCSRLGPSVPPSLPTCFYLQVFAPAVLSGATLYSPFSQSQFLSAIPISESVTVFVAFPAQHMSPPLSLFSHHSVLPSSVAYLMPSSLEDISSTIGT